MLPIREFIVKYLSKCRILEKYSIPLFQKDECFGHSQQTMWVVLIVNIVHQSDDTIAKVKENCLNIWKIRKYVVILHPHFVALCPKHKFN